MSTTQEKTTTYSTVQVLEMVGGGMSYRSLDYFLRKKAVTLQGEETPGSGQRRVWTEAEVEALRRLVARYAVVREEMARIHDGRAWQEEITAESWRDEEVA